MNVTYKQKELLLKLMKDHPDVARGRVSRKSESRKELKVVWEKISKTINAIGEGPLKSGMEWAKTWKDMKMYVLKKETKRRNHVTGTGGGSPARVNFTSVEEDLLEILTPEAVGIPNIPQGGFVEEYNQIDDNPSVSMTEHDVGTSVAVDNDVPQNMSYEEQESDIDNPPPQSFTSRKCAKRSVTSMLELEKQKLNIKKEKLELKKQALELQRNVLSELTNIKNCLTTWVQVDYTSNN